MIFQSNLSVTVSFICIIEPQETLTRSIDTLKKWYNTTIGAETLERMSVTAPYRSRFFVDLVLAKFEKNDDLFSKKEFNEKAKGITLEELIHNEVYKMTLVRGVGGVGKTFMMKTIAIQWARNKLWRNIKFLFFLTFRELNLYNVSTLREMLELKYPDVFNKVKFSKLFDLDILFLLDGVDEFEKLDDFKKIANGINTNNISNTAKAIYQVINPNSEILPNRKVIITGRPDACSQLLWLFDIMRIKEVDLLGLSPAKVK